MKAITEVEYKKIAVEQDFLKKTKIKPFGSPRRMWMKKCVKFRMNCHHKIFNLGVWQINWEKIQK